MKKISAPLAIVFLCLNIFLAAFSLTSCGKEEPERNTYKISAVFDGEKIDGTLTYITRTDKDVVEFNLYANAYKENAKFPVVENEDILKAYPEGTSYGGIDINSVSVNQKNADYELIGEDLNILRVPLSASNDMRAEVEIAFTTHIPHSITRLGINLGKVNLGDFFPVACVYGDSGYYECTYSPFGDPYYSEACDYEISLTVPSVYTVASSGFPVSTETGGENTTYSFTLSGGRDFAFALGKDFAVTVKETDHASVYYYSTEENVKMAELAASCIDYFSEIFGEYPYKTYSVAEVGFLEGGMEYSGLSLISESLSSDEKFLAIIHETAHEWWHAVVGNNQIEDAYLDEGLAEYSTYLYLLNNGYSSEAEEMLSRAKSAYKSFFSIDELLAGTADTTMNRKLSEFKNKYEYVNIAYHKALIMFSEYENAVGQSRAIKGLSAFYKKNAYQNVCIDNLIDCLGLKEFFYSYIDGKVII